MAELVDHQRRTFDEEVAVLTAVLGDENLARVLVATAQGSVAEVQRFFYVNTVRFTWENGSGVQVAFDFQNYVEVRYGEIATQPNQRRPTTTRRPVELGSVGDPLSAEQGGTQPPLAISGLPGNTTGGSP